MTDIADAGQTERRPEMTFYFELTSMRPISATYTSDEGFSRSFMLLGTTARDSGGPYRDKPVRVILAAPASERLASFAAEHGVERPCGSVLIRKGVDPRHHDEGPPDPAIQIAIAVDHDTLDRLYGTARGTIEGRKVLGLNLMASSKAFEGLGYGWPRPEDLDVSEDRAYPVVAFSLTPMLADLPDPRDARPARPAYERQERTPLTIKVTDMRADLESWSLKPFKIMIGGEIVGQQSLKGLSVDIDIVEFERDMRTGQYPNEAYPGEFSFYPKDGTSTPFFKLVLNFTPRDFERMTPLLLASRGSIIEASLNTTRQEIETAREPLYGDIQSLSFGLRSGQS